MTLEEKILQQVEKQNLSNDDAYLECDMSFVDNIISICQQEIDEAKVEENKRWVKYADGLSKFGDTGIYRTDFENRIKELSPSPKEKL